jgi:hypothetical protein
MSKRDLLPRLVGMQPRMKSPVFSVVMINVRNRLDAATRQITGEFVEQYI